MEHERLEKLQEYTSRAQAGLPLFDPPIETQLPAKAYESSTR